MTPNINLASKIPYGYVSANDLDQDIVDILQGYTGGANITASSAETAWQGFKATIVDLLDPADLDEHFDEDFERQKFFDEYEDNEPTVEGVYADIHYASSWMGGALHFFIFYSPFIATTAGRASPCVPNAGILKKPHEREGDVLCYDVPPDWWDTTVVPACHNTWIDQFKED